MKTLQQIQDEILDAYVVPTEIFIKYVKSGLFTDWDGIGSFHDGEIETDIDIKCDVSYLEYMKNKYPFVCWYNKNYKSRVLYFL